jgi:hypothetical protein
MLPTAFTPPIAGVAYNNNKSVNNTRKACNRFATKIAVLEISLIMREILQSGT